MKNKFKIPALILCSLFAFGCNKPNTPEPEIPDDHKEDDKKDMISYKDIYNFVHLKSNVKSGLVTYRASDGYIGNEVQGYNHFYYLAKEEGNYFQMTFENKKFNFKESYIENDLLKSTDKIFATRCFLSPVTGKAKISTSAFLKEGTFSLLKIYVNDDVIFEKEVGSAGIYVEKVVDLNENDNVYFEISGDSLVSINPEIDFTLRKELELHNACDGYYGDVHPFYDFESKKMHMYYLSTGNQKGEKYDRFRSMLDVSSDFLHYSPVEINMDDSARPEQDLYFVLNVFKDKEGKYRSSMGMGNHTTTSVSEDLVTWKNGLIPYIDPEDDLFKYQYAAYYDTDVISGRDPDMIYDKGTDSYYTVTMNYLTSAGAKGTKYLTLYIGNGQGKFSTTGYKLVNFTGRGDPECPQIKHIGNRWYIFYSVVGTGTKGNVGKFAYRMGDENTLPQNVNWEEKEERYLDGEDLHAAQLNEVGDKFYAYGWLNYQYNTSVWGGYLNIPHEVFVDSDGTLSSRLDEELLRLLNKGQLEKFNKEFTNNVDSVLKLDRNMITFDVEVLNNEDAGIVIEHNSDKFFIGVENRVNKKYVVIKNLADDYKVSNELRLASDNKYSFTVLLDNDFIDVDVNHNRVLSSYGCLTNLIKNLSIKANDNKLSNLTVYKLASSQNVYF
ncbi:MAG: hypothetical protein IJ656_03295 [Bacilli bacterium]|nr:hypothetical protein [Bacilli bacterium]MBR1582038.1 hypothetical protein [Bacilli bacterium]